MTKITNKWREGSAGRYFKGNNEHTPKVKDLSAFEALEIIIPELFNRKFVASEPLNKGDIINIFKDGNNVKIRKAKADSYDTIAHGFVNNNAEVNEEIDIMRLGNIQIENDFPKDSNVFLSTEEGGKMTTEITQKSGNILQKVGFVIDNSNVFCSIEEPIIRA